MPYTQGKRGSLTLAAESPHWGGRVEWAALNREGPAGSSGPGYRACVSSDFESEAEALKLARRGLVRQLTDDLDLNRKSQEKGVQRLQTQ